MAEQQVSDPADTGSGGAGTKTTTTKPSSTPITTVRSPADLHNIAANQVDSAIAGETAPLQGNIASLTTREGQANASIKDMFGSILPASQQAATNLQGAYDQAENAQQQIFSAATQQMNQLRQGRAQEAQALAQQIGGPVAVGEFTSSMGYEPEALANLGSGQMLHTLGLAQADVGQAQAFAGRVLPLVQTEQESESKKYYEDQIVDLQKQIATLKGTRGDKINSTYNDLLTSERTYQLNQAQQKLDALKAKRDWSATQKTLKNEDARLKIAQDQLALQKSQYTGKYKGMTTLQAKNLALAQRRLTDQEKQQAAQMGLSNKQYALSVARLQAGTALAQQRIAVSQRHAWGQYLDAALNPKAGKTVTETHTVPVPAAAAILGKLHNVIVDKSSPTGYSQVVKTVSTPQVTPISNPTQLVQYLVGHNVPKSVAVKMVRTRLNIGTWNFGEPDPRIQDAAHHK